VHGLGPNVVIRIEIHHTMRLEIVGYTEIKPAQALRTAAFLHADFGYRLIGIVRKFLSYHLADESKVVGRLDAETMGMSQTAQPYSTAFNPPHIALFGHKYIKKVLIQKKMAKIIELSKGHKKRVLSGISS